MTKTFKNVLISLCGAFAFLFAGIFFTGCKIDYSKISLTSNVTSLELEVGETADVVFTVENYKKGFSNRISVGSRSDESEAIFETDSVRYLNDKQVRVTIKAIAGGHGQLHVKTLEGEKECFVDVSVTQYSSSMASRNDVLYVSNETDFIPAPSMFDFDLHTTHTKLSHYMFVSRVDFDERSFKINEIDEENGTLKGIDGTGGELDASIIRFDVAKLEKEEGVNKLRLFLNGEVVFEYETLPSSFKMISIYDHSVGNIDYADILYAFSDVYVLPSLDVQVSGGYLNERTNEVDFKPLDDNRIVIVPNSPADADMRNFILKIEMISAVVDSEISFIKETSNNFVDVDLYDDFMEMEEGTGDVVHYWKISQNSQTQNSTELSFSIFYKLAADVFDESVNVSLDYQVDIEIAPTSITVNGTPEPETFYLYNEYENDRFGWQEVFVDVVSGFNSSPNFEGVYLTFDPTNVDVKYGDNDIVVSGNSRIYSDLSKSFYIRGKGDLGGGNSLNSTVTVHLVSDILPNELTLDLNCIIIKGATAIQRSEGYTLSERSRFVFDVAGGAVSFNRQLYADQMFQDVTYRCQSATSVVSIDVDKNNPYIENGGRYYLNLTITPLAVGDAVYTIYLDNGTSTSISFSVVRTLQPETTRVFLLDSGNDAVSSYAYSRGEDAEFDNILTLEILNKSDKDSITFGSVALLGFSANVKAGGISFVSNESQFVSVAQTGENYRLLTLANGNSLVTFTLRGEIVEDFATVDRELEILVYASSYSLVDEFYLQNGSARATNNTVYYGINTKTSDKTVVLNAVANNSNSSNFYQYFFDDKFAEIFDYTTSQGLIESEEGYTYNLTGDEYYRALQTEKFDKRFMYFYALRTNGNAVAGGVATKVDITKHWLDNGRTESLTKSIELVASNGLMFLASNFTYEKKDGDETVATYDVVFSNIYSVGFYGSFDIETLTYVNSYDTSSISFDLEADISQRGRTKSFKARITSQEFISVENISLASNLTELNLSSKKMTYSFGAYIYPTNSTNKNIVTQFVASSGYDHEIGLIDCSVAEGESGSYTITISCENFYNYYNERGIRIEDFTDDLSGTLYIFPAEWGSSYTVLGGKEAIVIDIQYCNGSELNPYVLETADDVLEINSNEIMLRSHYKIATIIDMSSVSGALPIGILNDVDGNRFVGFSGSIIGTSSQAGITNIAVSNNNFCASVDGVTYAGLFAQVGAESVDDAGQRAKIENVSFSGKVDFVANETSYVSVLAARNKGKLENVGVTVYDSNITASNTLVFGAVAGENYGYILQDFTRFDGSDKESRYVGLTSKNLAYYNEFANIATNNQNVYAGGVVGVSYGTVERKVSSVETYKLYGYSAYTALSRMRLSGNAGLGTQIYVGGVVGKVSNEKTSSKIYGSTSVIENKVGGLLVGGEISTISLVGDVQDAIGGIVGYATTDNVRVVNVVENVSRIFVRGIYNVGGIAGFDSYSQNAHRVNFGAGNLLEAVDAGNTAFEASMLIKANEANYYNESITNTNPVEVFYAIGNAMSVNRNYNTTGCEFSAVSYVKRSKLEGVVSATNSSTKDYYGDYIVLRANGTAYSYEFEKRDVSLGAVESEYQMKLGSVTEGGQNVNVYMMYYFATTGRLNGTSEGLVQDEISRLNYFTPNSAFYPFSLTSQDVSISSASNELSVDVNGNITVKDAGLAYITLNSILNVKEEQRIYLYIVNYFDKNFDYSIFYTRPSSDGVNVVNGSSVNIYGNSNTSVYLVPSYELDKKFGEGGEVISPVTADGEAFSITKNGILTFRNVSYALANNTQLLAEAFAEGENNYSTVQTNKQTIVFVKSENADSYDGEYVGDYYTLKPSLKVSFSIGDVNYEFYYNLSGNATISVEVKYRDSAESINPSSSRISVKTNEPYSDSISVKSTNEDEVLFYEIFQVIDGEQELIQSRLPKTVGEYYIDSKAVNSDGTVGFDNWKPYINTITNKDLFDLTFTKNGNVFEYSCKVNDTSTRFLNRANVNIYGEYKVYLYASELENGVSAMFRIMLSEAEINYVDITNYSNQNDLSVADEIVVPSQTGLMEIAIDPVEATFNRIEISNSDLNYQSKATEASLLFVYEKNSADGVEFVASQNFGTYENGKLVFTYQDMINYFEVLNDTLNRQNGVSNKTDSNYQTYVEYNGKVYVSYYMPSLNVDDGVRVGFDVAVYYGKENIRQESQVRLITKLGSYARLSFDNKRATDGVYYVARGLSYGLTMEAYGFSSDQISVTASDNSLVSISGGNGKYTLEVTSGIINYGASTDPGRRVEITTYAQKIVDNVVVPYQETMTIFIMEYVLDYVYVAGVNEDIVAGMEDGTIYTAVGNPFDLEFSIRSFLEYDSSNSMINEEVEEFISNMTQNIEWAVYYNGVKTLLESEKTIRTDYYSIKSFTVTPLRIYNPEVGIYRFSANANYRVQNGTYSYSSLSTGANQMYTEFVFDVHEQSTQDSPIPVESYSDFVGMKDNEWYILLTDITLPSSELATVNGVEQFKPLTANLAGFDGNGYRINMGGTYDYGDSTNIGIFERVSEGMILQNVDVCVTSETIIRTNQSGFNVGLLTATNEGVITNCEVFSQGGANLSVVSSTTTSSAYVGGLVGNNSGHITNSRSKLNIKANVNVAGFVGQNSGVIASSYFKGASLTNQTNTTTEFTAGFAVTNSGKIYTSYVSGDPAEVAYDEEVYYQGTEDSIVSSNNITGFVYSNSGDVEDCYSNIVLSQSGAFSAGFIFENSGNIKRCFSTSTLESNQTSNYGFMRANNIGAQQGLVEDCFYISDETANNGKGINVSIGTIVQDDRIGLRRLSCAEFNDLENFKNYAVVEGREINSVWFISRSGGNPLNFNGAIFDLKRPELVAPNIEATSRRELDRTESVVDPETGMSSVRYIYTYVSGYPTLGSVYNPILISDAETMEEYITRENNGAGYNYAYYRLIDDIDYSEYQYNSKLYETKFMGYMEGNFMQINGISLISSTVMNYAGMFAEVGRTGLSGAVGALLNFTVKPISVSFANTNVVGGITGRLDGGTLINVRIENASTNNIVVSGTNIVGGAVGIAIGDYKIQNLYSQSSAKARNLSVDESNNFNEATINFDDCSMAGSVVGVLSGTGSIYNVVTDSSVSVLANKAGLMFGVVDSEAGVEKVRLTVFPDMIVNAHTYGGLVAGEIKGNLADIVVEGDSVFNFANFMNIPFYATAVGGVAGLMSGGQLSNVTMNQSIHISTSSDSVQDPPYLGGVVGEISDVSVLSGINVTANLAGFSYVGGVVGGMLGVPGRVNIQDVSYSGMLVAQGHSLEAVGVGGLVGQVGDLMADDNSTFSLTGSEVYVKTSDRAVVSSKTYYILENGEYKAVERPVLSNLGNYFERTFNTNRFNVTIQSTVYTYGESVRLNIGAIVGENLANGSSYVDNANSRLDAEIHTLDMSEVLQNTKSTMEVVERDEETIVNVSGAIGASSILCSNSKFYCYVEFNCPNSESSDFAHSLTVLNVGDANLGLKDSV